MEEKLESANWYVGLKQVANEEMNFANKTSEEVYREMVGKYGMVVEYLAQAHDVLKGPREHKMMIRGETLPELTIEKINLGKDDETGEVMIVIFKPEQADNDKVVSLILPTRSRDYNLGHDKVDIVPAFYFGEPVSHDDLDLSKFTTVNEKSDVRELMLFTQYLKTASEMIVDYAKSS